MFITQARANQFSHSGAIGLISLILLLQPLMSSAKLFQSEIYQKAISHPARPAQDKPLDKTRLPLNILPFSQIGVGDKVLELGAGGGYTTELLSRVVGKDGVVYAQGLSPLRVASDRLPNVVALRQHLLYQLPKVLKENKVKNASLDKVVIFFALHDFYLNDKIDKAELYAVIHRQLKKNGKLIILDNAAGDDDDLKHNRRLHRIGKNFVINELKKAGFEVEAESNALKNPADDHSKRWQEFNGLHDRFAIRFVKKSQ